MTLPFGPYRGFSLVAVPDHHLYYLIERTHLRKPVLDAVIAELERRAQRRLNPDPRSETRSPIAVPLRAGAV